MNINITQLLGSSPYDIQVNTWKYDIKKTFLSSINLLKELEITSNELTFKTHILQTYIEEAVEWLAESNAEENIKLIRQSGLREVDGRFYQEVCIGNPEQFDCYLENIGADDYANALEKLLLEPDNTADVLDYLSIKDQIELVSSDEIDISDDDSYEDIGIPFPWHEKYLIASLACCLCAEHSASETEKAELAIEAIKCFMEAKLHLQSQSFKHEEHKLAAKAFELERLDKVLSQEKRQIELQKAQLKNKSKQMQAAKRQKIDAAVALLTERWLPYCKSGKWKSAEAAAEDLHPVLKENGYNYSFRWVTENIRNIAKANHIKLR
jgi:hypothetical protein